MTTLTKDTRTTYTPGSPGVPADPGRPATPAHYVTTFVPDPAPAPSGTKIIGYRKVYIPPDPVSGADGYYTLFPIWG